MELRDNSHFESVEQILREWHAPTEAIRLAGAIRHLGQHSGNDELINQLLSEVGLGHLQGAAKRWGVLSRLPRPSVQGTKLIQDLSLKLRLLYRAAYMDLSLVLFVIADHAVWLERKREHTQPGNANSFWMETETVFLPLLTMLGMWQLRRKWVESTAKRLYPVEYGEIEKRLKATYEAAHASKSALEHRLRRLSQNKVQFEMFLHQPYPGRIIYRMRRGEALEELITTVPVKIITANTSDCYRLLEYLHQIGRPISGSLSDHIGALYANGYRALHSAIVGSGVFPEIQNTQFAVRLVSEDMDRINELGIIAHLPSQGDGDIQLATWWNRYAQTEGTNALVAKNEIGGSAEDGGDIYVFTPRGEVKQLKQGSTVIDFAYALHSYIGNHCRSVEVNGQQAAHSQALQNGDLIHLKIDKRFQGPDPNWLHYAQNKQTKALIRKALRAQDHLTHPGKRIIERLLDSLRLESGFVIPNPQLETYFDQAAKQLNLESTLALFEMIKPQDGSSGGKLSPDRLLSFILEAELSGYVVDSDGNPFLPETGTTTHISDPHIRFCPTCKPVPGAEIVLHSRGVQGAPMLTLHRQPREQTQGPETEDVKRQLFGIPRNPGKSCLRTITNPQTLNTSVRWKYVAPERRIGMVTLFGRDRNRLLGDMLLPIYLNDRLDLKSLRGNVAPDGHVDTLMTVEFDSLDQIERLLSQFGSIDSVDKVMYWPVEEYRPHHLRSSHGDLYRNPYSPGDPVRDGKIFVGRTRELKAITGLVLSHSKNSLCILHGHRRSGKTSLAHRAMAEVTSVSRAATTSSLAVYIDLQLITATLTKSNFYHFVASEICYKLENSFGNADQTMPELPAPTEFAQNPFFKFRAYINSIRSQLGSTSLFLVLDEFNLLVAEHENLPGLFNELRSTVSSADFPCHWLLITHTRFYQFIPQTHPAKHLYELANAIEVPLLDTKNAFHLIEEPVKERLRYSQDVVSEIVRRSSGQPYVINLICHKLVENVGRDGRTFVTMDDLRRAVAAIFRNGTTYFNFAMEAITEAMKPAVVAIARAGKLEKGLSKQDVLKLVAADHVHAAQELEELVYKGVLQETTEDQANPQLRIRVDYFREWVNLYWD